MSIALLVGGLWTVGLTAVVAVCRAAARGDRALERQLATRRFSADVHEFRLRA